MPIQTQQGIQRKSFAVKRQDGEPLTRADLQHDLLHYIFSNSLAVFTDPYAVPSEAAPPSLITFRDLYLNTLTHSPRCSKVSREKIAESPDFGDEFAKISLLSNVGRINTTMAFFPEMLTALRTYHPVPCLQKTDGNLQDAPRIKNILKSSFLERETEHAPATPSEVIAELRNGKVPSTSIVNLIFIFASHARFIARTHFPPTASVDFLDLFTPVNYSSESRAHAFLWLCYNYLESQVHNPFANDQSDENMGRIPEFMELSAEQVALENVDTLEEIAWGSMMSNKRALFLESRNKDARAKKDKGGFVMSKGRTQSRRLPAKKRIKTAVAMGTSDVVEKCDSPQTEGDIDITVGQMQDELERPAVRTSNVVPIDDHSLPSFNQLIFLPPLPSVSAQSYIPPQPHNFFPTLPSPQFRTQPTPSEVVQDPSDLPPLRHLLQLSAISDPMNQQLPPLRSHFPQSFEQAPRPPNGHHACVDPYPRIVPPPASYSPQSTHGKPIRTRTPYDNVIQYSAPAPKRIYPATMARFIPHARKSTMLEQAWHLATATDSSLYDTDENSSADEDTRSDLLVRLRILNRLRGKEPTPEPQIQAHPPERLNA